MNNKLFLIRNNKKNPTYIPLIVETPIELLTLTQCGHPVYSYSMLTFRFCASSSSNTCKLISSVHVKPESLEQPNNCYKKNKVTYSPITCYI